MIDVDALDALVAEYKQVILDRAATWTHTFEGGPGEVVSVSDAAHVLARHELVGDGPVITHVFTPAGMAEHNRKVKAETMHAFGVELAKAIAIYSESPLHRRLTFFEGMDRAVLLAEQRASRIERGQQP